MIRALDLDRRLLLKAGALGAGALAMPAGAALAKTSGFTHNVASGEPGPDRMMLWTRYLPIGGGEARIEAEVSEDAGFARIVRGGTVSCGPERDHTAKLVVEGLAPGRTYHYRFRAPDGSLSPVGRTRTLPDGQVRRFGIGIFSCANLPFGWFNAYAHAAGREDIDLMVHLGDYLYEYQAGSYPSSKLALAERVIAPAHELVALADYRARFAAYRSDPDLQRLHQYFPMVMMWDDHESANNAWRDGAQNHQDASEGAWAVRKAAAMRAYREWLPVGEESWQSYQIGDLATLFRPETRLIGRSMPIGLGTALAQGGDVGAALAAFRDGPWRDSSRTMLGLEQEGWLAEGLARSRRAGTRWQILAQQVIMGELSLSPKVAEWMLEKASPEGKQTIALHLAASEAGLPINFDAWGGFPAARRRLLAASTGADADLIVLSGDSHNGWAFDLDLDGMPAGVEFAGHSVSSPGYESAFPFIDPRDMAGDLVAHNRQLRWADTSRRGYLTIELTPERATGEWLFMDTIRERSTILAGRHAMTVRAGARRLTAET
ncbi:alkaline phosphatase D family protein [Sphingosinicella rhizophila]|uniref:Alkaline phosphatase D family protein n=1 Tax=Sphingosinicella rhizophila TaxID=3050082 RepID=A0ABU3Q6A7_9SPHN|nr:alkaline phosphatase D family protein [Sphingosinicella sp. GR2756]MDT9598940.1 alkaline phosphatase D family protein [Sphingosinicella sp. GR2756]